ncbi:MAG: glycosyltransferase family 2 protein [Gammaproteobacteria bacterium]|nr:glycosyltransferase family 2 protein [Gammaproteobacteria bacterium]
MSDSITPTCELTVLMPCLNEAETIATCIDKAQGYMTQAGVDGEVLIADNGSTDGSQDIARAHGARVVAVSQPGYGAALLGGIDAARGRYVIMGDADDSYDFARLQGFVDQLRAGYQLVMGNRFLGGIAPGAMPPLHRYLGNPVLSFVGRLFFRSPVRDFHCGLRGFDRDAIRGLKLVTPGMEFASEMVVKATLNNLRMTEVPTTLSPDGRGRPPHLRSWRDGWRHLRFLLIFSPRWLFLYPGLAMLSIGLLTMLALLPGPLRVAGIALDIHTMLFAALAMVVGNQAVQLGLFSRLYGMRAGLLPSDPAISRLFEFTTLERGLILGVLLVVAGLAGSIAAVLNWGKSAFGSLDPEYGMRLAIPSATAITIGAQMMFGSFFLGVLKMRTGSDE